MTLANMIVKELEKKFLISKWVKSGEFTEKAEESEVIAVVQEIINECFKLD